MIEELFKQYDIPFSEEILKKINLFYNLLCEENKKYNLTNIIEYDQFVYKHILDSLLPYKSISEFSYICDIGAGAGFPSIPLSIIYSEKNFVLLDSVSKKINFINIVKNNLKLNNIFAVHTRIEDFANKNKKTFDCVLARGVAPLNTLLEYSIPLLKINGLLLAYKSVSYKNELEISKNAISSLFCSLIKILNFSFKYQNEIYNRNILLFKKNKETPIKFPRNNNKPRTNPL